jgi:nitrite reductase/ring-hydroxylating ferredoxin subunit
MSERLCRLDEIPDGESRGFEITVGEDEVEIFVVRKGDDIYGYLNDCPHIGTPLNWNNDKFLTLDGAMIVCATHGALFRIEDGHCTAGPCIGTNLKRIEVINRSGEVLVLPPGE